METVFVRVTIMESIVNIPTALPEGLPLGVVRLEARVLVVVHPVAPALGVVHREVRPVVHPVVHQAVHPVVRHLVMRFSGRHRIGVAET